MFTGLTQGRTRVVGDAVLGGREMDPGRPSLPWQPSLRGEQSLRNDITLPSSRSSLAEAEQDPAGGIHGPECLRPLNCPAIRRAQPRGPQWLSGHVGIQLG